MSNPDTIQNAPEPNAVTEAKKSVLKLKEKTEFDVRTESVTTTTHRIEVPLDSPDRVPITSDPNNDGNAVAEAAAKTLGAVKFLRQHVDDEDASVDIKVERNPEGGLLAVASTVVVTSE